MYHIPAGGSSQRVAEGIERPNGIMLSRDEQTLYVANADARKPVVMAYAVRPSSSAIRGRVFFDATPLVRAGRKGVPDGMKIDQHGNMFLAGPGGVLVLSPAGKHLGTIVTGQPTANCAFGEDGSMLYITANDRLLRIKTRTRGLGF